MRKTLLAMAAFAAASAFAPPPAQAVEYPWCAQYGGRGGDGGRNCGFVSFEQCMATVSGAGGYCERNSMYRAGDVRPVRRKVRRRY
jgi:hypothetical protein